MPLDICKNLISTDLSSRDGVRVIFEFGKVILTKESEFVGK